MKHWIILITMLALAGCYPPVYIYPDDDDDDTSDDDDSHGDDYSTPPWGDDDDDDDDAALHYVTFTLTSLLDYRDIEWFYAWPCGGDYEDAWELLPKGYYVAAGQSLQWADWPEGCYDLIVTDSSNRSAMRYNAQIGTGGADYTWTVRESDMAN